MTREKFLAAICSLVLTAAVAPAAMASPSRVDSSLVKEQLQHAWAGYVQYAWGHDSLKPLSKSHHDWYGATLLMTPVDALDTMLMMGLTAEAKQAQDLITEKLSFDKDITVSTFETTIRILGGLLSSYQLTGDNRLLALADDLGTRLLPAFDSPTGMPYARVNLKTGHVSKARSNPAEIGSLMLEFGTLGKLSGNPAYYEKARHALIELYRRSSRHGLVGSEIDVETGGWLNTEAHIGGGIDSYYEYLYKSWLLFGEEEFHAMWLHSIEGINKYVADGARGALWYGQVDMNTGRRKGTQYGSLDAFFAGLLALSGDVKRAARLQTSNFKMWNMFGIEPEQFDYRTSRIIDPVYRLRPEIIESAYYLHYFTGDQRYLDMGTTFVEGLTQHCRTNVGFAELGDVRTKAKVDSMESYFFAETLKYAYLLFSPKTTLDLSTVVFNTEAHPLKRTW